MKISACYFITCVMMVFTSCEKGPADAAFENKLIGKWMYTGQSGGFAGKYQPADPSKPSFLEFKENKTFVKTVSNAVIEEGSYAIIQLKSIYSGKVDNAIRFHAEVDSPKSGEIATITKDTLNIADNYYDGYSKGYIRIQ
jgi:hypothetical protein